MTEFSATTLPNAIQKLFEMNHYDVEGPIQIHGAEVDLVARPIADPFGATVYIEATIEYVDNQKYGKDVGKLAMIAELEPGSRKLIVSSKGFSAPVAERANATRIETLTYNDLFKRFERFEPYVSSILGDTSESAELRRLSDIYEEPEFADSHGHDQATTFLTDWKNSHSSVGRWLLITGEYGTGKTALTKVLQYRWLSEYQINPQSPLPLRMELREFANQFDARGLLHHFLDHNNLGHLSLDFVFTLIRSGRAILILDGYDEMAQYLHARERRACLEALSQLSAGGAKGILTSRPNYFTEAEELQMFEILYKSLEYGQYVLGSEAKELLEKERQVDKLLEQFIDRYERILKDLTPEQTEALIHRVLSEDEKGREVVLNLLSRIFRTSDEEDEIALSGKPVIVSYLLEVVEGLKDSVDDDGSQTLTEWQVYKLIIDQLMLRDFKRSPEILPDIRRRFLRKIAFFLSKREHPVVSEDNFRDIVGKEFRRELERLPSESQGNYLEQLFSDLRSSATLTRGGQGLQYGWRFSHNSLREYLVAETLVVGLEDNDIVSETVTISDAMKIFASSMAVDRRERLVDQLSRAWQKPGALYGRGQLLALLWDGMVRLYPKAQNQRETCLKAISGEPPQLTEVILSQMELSSETHPASLENSDFLGSHLSDVNLSGADLTGADFSNATLESVNFENANLRAASFRNSFIMDSDFSGSIVQDADFTGVDPDAISILLEFEKPPGKELLYGLEALGYLKFEGAKTQELQPIYVLQHHPAFLVVDKILEKLAQQSLRQRRGLEQRGAAHHDVSLAKDFVNHLENSGLLFKPKNRKDLVQVSDRGRKVFSKYAGEKDFSEELLSFFVERPSV